MKCLVIWWLTLVIVFHPIGIGKNMAKNCRSTSEESNQDHSTRKESNQDHSTSKESEQDHSTSKESQQDHSTSKESQQDQSTSEKSNQGQSNRNEDARRYIQALNLDLKNRSSDAHGIVQKIKTLKDILEKTKVNKTTSMSSEDIVTLLHESVHDFKGLEINANDTEARSDSTVSNVKVKILLPRKLDIQKNNTVVFCMIRVPDKVALKPWDELYDHRLVGLSVAGKTISSLQDRVNISIYITTNLNKTVKPRCVFLNTTDDNFSSDGCETIWDYNQNYLTCSCDHLTYFAVLMVSADLSPKDQEILFYITYIGCGISLFALVITVLLLITNRKFKGDDSKKIHISLAVALILLNIHFLPSQAVAAMSSSELCFYVALLLHYSLLASFTWMALEGFHLYLLLVKVFNIYVKRYLLKLSVVGWGLPAVIVSIMVIRSKDTYGRTPLDFSKPNETAICYITDDTAKMVTTVGLFSMVFLFNVIMFGVTIKWYLAADLHKEHGWSKHRKAKQEMCTLLVLVVLLGLTWGLIFFSFGHLSTPGIYSFCILNSLQGFSISVYFVLSWRKTKDSAGKPSSEVKVSTT